MVRLLRQLLPLPRRLPSLAVFRYVVDAIGSLIRMLTLPTFAGLMLSRSLVVALLI